MPIANSGQQVIHRSRCASGDLNDKSLTGSESFEQAPGGIKSPASWQAVQQVASIPASVRGQIASQVWGIYEMDQMGTCKWGSA